MNDRITEREMLEKIQKNNDISMETIASAYARIEDTVERINRNDQRIENIQIRLGNAMAAIKVFEETQKIKYKPTNDRIESITTKDLQIIAKEVEKLRLMIEDNHKMSSGFRGVYTAILVLGSIAAVLAAIYQIF